MYYKYKCTCGKELYAEHGPTEMKEICSQIDADCKEEMFLIREDVEIQIRKDNEEIKKSMEYYSTDDQEVLRERLKKHLEEIELEANKQIEEPKELSPMEALEMFRKANEEQE